MQRWGLDARDRRRQPVRRPRQRLRRARRRSEVVHETAAARRHEARLSCRPNDQPGTRRAVGYLEELKRQADEALAQQTQDIGALQRNALAHRRCLPDGLALLRHAWRASSTCCSRCRRRSGASTTRPRSATCASAISAPTRACKKLRDEEVFDHVFLGFSAKTGTRVTIAKDFPPEIERLEARLRQCGAALRQRSDPRPGERQVPREALRAPGRLPEHVRVLPDHDSAWITFHIANLDGFETVSVVFPAFEVGTGAARRAGALDQRRAACVPARRPARSPRRGLSAAPPGAPAPGRLNCRLSARPRPCRCSGSPTPPTSPRSSRR